MLFVRSVFVATLGVTVAEGALLPNHGVVGDGIASVIYVSQSGELSIDPPVDVLFSSVNIHSTMGVFAGPPSDALSGSFDEQTQHTIFKATFGFAFGAVDFGPIAQPGLTAELLRNDFEIVTATRPQDAAMAWDLIFVPEPSGLTLVLAGAALFTPLLWRIRNTGSP